MLSQKGKTMKQTIPMTSMAMIFPDAHPDDCLDAIVREIRMSANAALKRSIPPISSSNQRCLITCTKLIPLNCDSVVKPSFFALRLFMNNDKARGMNMTGKIMHQIPYPHLQVVVFKISCPISDPIQTVIRNGISGKLDHRALFKRSLVSAMKICCRICNPVLPAE